MKDRIYLRDGYLLLNEKNFIELGTDVYYDGKILDYNQFSYVLKKISKDQTKQAYIFYSSGKFRNFTINSPKLKTDEVEGFIEFELRDFFMVDPDEIKYTYKIKNTDKNSLIHLYTYPKNEVQAIEEAFEDANIKVLDILPSFLKVQGEVLICDLFSFEFISKNINDYKKLCPPELKELCEEEGISPKELSELLTGGFLNLDEDKKSRILNGYIKSLNIYGSYFKDSNFEYLRGPGAKIIKKLFLNDAQVESDIYDLSKTNLRELENLIKKPPKRRYLSAIILFIFLNLAFSYKIRDVDFKSEENLKYVGDLSEFLNSIEKLEGEDLEFNSIKGAEDFLLLNGTRSDENSLSRLKLIECSDFHENLCDEGYNFKMRLEK